VNSAVEKILGGDRGAYVFLTGYCFLAI